MLRVDTVCMETQAQQMARIAEELNDIASRVASVNRNLRWSTSINASVKCSLSSSSSTVSSLDNKAKSLSNVLCDIAKKYEYAENQAAKPDPSSSGNSSSSSLSEDQLEELIRDLAFIISKSHGKGGLLAPYYALPFLPGGIFIGNLLTGDKLSDTTSTTEAYGDWFGYEVADDHPGVTGWIGKGHAKYQEEDFSAEVNGYIGKGEAGIDGDFSLFSNKTTKKFEDGKWVESEKTTLINAEGEVKASVKGLSGDASVDAGDDMFGAGVNVDGTVGSAGVEGKGKFSIGEDGVNLYAEGEAMVAAAEGKASGTLNILGIEITVSAGGYAGALGVEGEIGVKDNKWVMEAGAAAGIGGSVGIEVGLNEEGWDNFVDFVTFWD